MKLFVWDFLDFIWIGNDLFCTGSPIHSDLKGIAIAAIDAGESGLRG